MSTTTRSRRRQRRYAVSTETTALVEFEHPGPHGRHYRLPVVNLSSSGLSFRTGREDGLERLESGTDLTGAIVRVGDCMIYGDMLVMHVTPETDASRVCGALFYPKSDTDLVKLKSVLAGMEIGGAD